MSYADVASSDDRASQNGRPVDPAAMLSGPGRSSIVSELYAVISVLDSENQSDLAGRLHALTLEIRERAAVRGLRKYS
jgi:hypothetical protein